MLIESNHIGSKTSAQGVTQFTSVNPATGEELEGQFYAASSTEVGEAVALAHEAFASYRRKSGKEKAQFLRMIADEILALGDELVQRAVAESGLPEGRIIGERGRTMGQLRLFADLLDEGSWVEASIDRAEPSREPLPKPDIRKMLVPLGPVVVFGASNFPLAFSTAGGDTASALAAGNPVILKAHASHAGTSGLVASAIVKAAKKAGMPEGVFSHLYDSGFSVGKQLVTASAIKAVAFTGSFNGGKALYDLAASRPDPIPVFAEMGSINPVILLPGALSGAEALAKQYAGSITLGTGQFCTNPGLLIGVGSSDLEQFKASLKSEIEAIAPMTMLNESISSNYVAKSKEITEQQNVKVLSKSEGKDVNTGGRPLVATTSGEQFLSNPKLHEEVFGPFSLVIDCTDGAQLDAIAAKLEGQLTVTVMGTEQDLEDHAEVIEKLKDKTGRIIFNGVPTGVEVCASMQHGGPFPATTDARFTSVGTGAIKRFVRPLCYQNWPDDQLPAELQDENGLGIWRLVDNSWSKD